MNDATSAATTRGRGRLWTAEEDEMLLRAMASSDAAAAAAAADARGANDNKTTTSTTTTTTTTTTGGEEEEDVAARPFQNWSDLASRLGGRRTGKMIRDRWTNYLDPKIDRSPFTRDDDVALYEAHGRYGKRWAVISEKAYGSRRSENHVKNRVS